MLHKVRMESCLSDFQCQRIQQINRKVGAIQLYSLRNLVDHVAKAQGRELNLPEDGYRSMFTPEMLDEPMKKFLSPFNFHPNRKRLTTAVSRVRKHLKGLGSLKPISLEEAFELLLHTKENNFAGLPSMGKKGDDTDALFRAMQCAQGKCPPPCVIGHRGKNTTAARAIWMFPFEWHICEGAYFFPLQEKFKRNVRIYAASNAVARRAEFNNLVMDGKYHSKLCLDYSGFDGTVGPQLIGIAFSLLREHLELDSRQEKLWNRIATYFATSPFVDQHGWLVTGRKGGVPSGSMFTQMIDTIVNAITIEYCLIELKKKYKVYGDDGEVLLEVTKTDLPNLLDDVKQRASELGIRVNLKKSSFVDVRQPVTFLGHYDLVPGRPADEVYARLIFPERPFEVTAESLRTRVVSYMAESDDVLGVLMPVYWMLTYSKGLGSTKYDYQSFADNAMSMVTHVELGDVNPRNMPGLAQFLANEDPFLVSSYQKIRAAV